MQEVKSPTTRQGTTRIPSPAPAEVEAQITELGDLGTPDLRQRWRQVTGREPGSGLKGELLRAALAQKLQEQAFGALPRDRLKRLESMAREAASMPGGRNASRQEGTPVSQTSPQIRARRRIKPGSRLLREWRGVLHEVVVTPSGYLWQGTVHASLSAIAGAITGTSWNGWRFFGVGAGRVVSKTARSSVERCSSQPRTDEAAPDGHSGIEAAHG